MLNSVYYLLMSVWAMWASYRKYEQGEQILTFYAVEVMLVCFIALRPWFSTLLTLTTYAAQFVIFWVIDRADGIHLHHERYQLVHQLLYIVAGFCNRNVREISFAS